MSFSHTPRYRTTNWSEYNQALTQRGSLTLWIDPNLTWRAPRSGKRGRQQTYSDEAIQFCLTLKVVFGLALRQTVGFATSLLKLMGMNVPVPDFSTLCRHQDKLAVAIPYRGSTGPLHLLIDSTGIKVEGEGDWMARKHGRSRPRQWRKIHLGVDEETLEVRAIEVTGAGVGDAPMLPELLNQIPPHEEIASVTADGAYDTRKCHEAISKRAARPVIPPRKNARFWKSNSPGAETRNEALRACKRFGRRLWRKWSGYHRRSRVETKMNCLKLLGQGLMAKTFDRQVAEMHIRIAAMNRFTALGTPVTLPVA